MRENKCIFHIANSCFFVLVVVVIYSDANVKNNGEKIFRPRVTRTHSTAMLLNCVYVCANMQNIGAFFILSI